MPQGAIGRDRIPRLEAVLRRHYAEHVGADQAVFVIWCEVPRGQAYTEGRLADGAWLMVEVEDGLDQARRERGMLAIGGEFARAAGLEAERMMVTLCDSALFGQYLKANSARMRALPRIGYLLRTLAGLWSSRRRDGFASISANF